MKLNKMQGHCCWLLAGILALSFGGAAWAAEIDQANVQDKSVLAPDATGFVAEEIRVQGLQRLPVSRVFGLLSIHEGERVTSHEVTATISKLYQSGDFEDVQLARDGNALVIIVSERPTISKIEFKGNKSINTDDLRKGLKSAHLTEGEVYKRSTVAAITGELKRQYVAQGRYAAAVETKVVPLPRNRVSLTIQIYEGKSAKIKDVNFVGNEVFSDEELLKVFKLRPTHFTSFFKGDDKYARDRLSGDLESLESYYLDRGYIRFAVESVQVSVSPTRDQVFITVNISEGKRYQVGKVSLEGEIPINREQLKPLLIMKQGQVYSQQIQTYTSDLLTRRLGNSGYTFAEVKGYPHINDDDLTVDVSFFVESGKRVYVNNITFTGNDKTEDEVLRRELRQFESAPANTSLIDLSKSRLERLGFFSKVEADTQPVPGTDDQLSVNYKVEEQPSGSIGANIGYSDANGVIFGASVSQNNFMGSGDRVSFSFSRSDVSTRYSFSHYNPYYTPDGVSRGFSMHYSKIDFDKANVQVGSYAADRKGASVTFGYPISEYSRVSFGAGVESIDVTYGTFVPQSIFEFLDREGTEFDSVLLNLGLSTSTLNNAVMPDRGWSQSTTLEVGTDMGTYPYYKLSLDAQRYFPLSKRWILRTRTSLGMGQGLSDSKELPFFENYYAGGIGSVRGYRSYSLGPRSPSKEHVALGVVDTDPDPVGGDALAEFSAELIFPTPFAPDSRSVRTFLFLDAGSTYSLHGSDPVYTRYLDDMRAAAGIGLTWITAIGPLSFDLGRALNSRHGDDTETFQFSLGQVF